ncbi:MAG: YfcE family phosphodiesterase [Candidatus Methanoperedens sp.]|nr:YfcE family phosphodiesterase [Candidatus Methanoperedens sp.]
MKIIAIADTHIKSGSIIDCLPRGLVELIKGADMVIHAGDFVTKQAYDELSGMCRLEAVHGNMDSPDLKKLLPAQKVIEIEGIKIGIVHEAALSLQDTTGAWYMAKEMGVEVLVFGHIHKPVIEKDDVLLACPGSPTAPRLSEPSAVELNIKDGALSGRVITFEGTRCGALDCAARF